MLDSQQLELKRRADDIKSELSGAREACVRLDQKVTELTKLVDCEREKRTVAERELAVLAATQANRREHDGHARKGRAHQGA